jgi:hypothetical protein
MSSDAGNRKPFVEAIRDRINGVGIQRSEHMMAMKELINPLLHAVREARDLCGDDRIGINLGISSQGKDVQFVGEMRVPEFVVGEPDRPVVPYEVKVMVDVQGNALVAVDAVSYSTRPEYRRDPDPVIAIHRTVGWHGVYDASPASNIADLVRLVRNAAVIHAAAKERQLDYQSAQP